MIFSMPNCTSPVGTATEHVANSKRQWQTITVRPKHPSTISSYGERSTPGEEKLGLKCLKLVGLTFYLALRHRLALLHNEFGISFFNRSRYAEAESEFSHACRHDPSVSQFVLNQGNAAYYQEKPLKAYNLYVKALKLDPHNREASMKLAEFRMAQSLAQPKSSSLVRT